MQNKSKKLTSRLLSALLSLACVLTLLPGVVVAAESTGSTGGMVVDKTAKLEDDGTYTIELSAYATGTTTTTTTQKAVPCDIVLVLDQSGSMSYKFGTIRRLEALQTAANNFIKSVQKDAATNQVDHRVAVVGFASERAYHSEWFESAGYYAYDNTEILSTNNVVNYEDAKDTDYQNALVSVNTNGGVNSRLTTAIKRLDAGGDTYSEYGVDMANRIFRSNPIDKDSDRVRVVIMFTDGYTAPNGTNNINYSMSDRAIANAKISKETYGATVYTVGIFTGADPDADIERNFSYGSTSDNKQLVAANRYMHYVSSNYPKAADLKNGGTKEASTYYLSASDTEQLNSIFKKISESVVTPSTTVTLNGESVMRDILNQGFVLPSEECTIAIETQAGAMNDDGTITWGVVTTNPQGLTSTVDEKNGIIDITGFNYSVQYIAKGHPGQKLTVTIRGIEARDEAITNAEISTNNALSGIYAKTDDETPAVYFPQPQTILKSKTYVLDYGKLVNLASQDWGIGSVTTLNGTGMHKFNTPVTNLTETYGKVETATTATGKTGLTYTPTTMNWKGYDSFYVFGRQIAPNGAINQWSKVTVMPANSVYYEDTFVTDTNAGTVGIVYGGEWTTDGTNANRDQALDDKPYGWEEGYAEDTTYSDGSAHKAVATADNRASASFTFTGTGVDVYSRTDLTTGTVAATLTKKGADDKEVGVKGLVVDNLAASVGKDGAYYQIPTLHFENLAYGEYTLTLYVTTAAKERATYYLDGVRVYNPIQGLEEEAVVKEAYGNAGELGASFQAVRDILIDAENFNPTNEVEGAVFIDQVENETGVTTNVIGTYEDYGPKNEVYLAGGQSIAFHVDVTQEANYYLGIKAPNGATTAEVTNSAGKSKLDIVAASDLYYKITPNAEGYILVQNTGNCLLSITKLRTTGANGESKITAANVSELLAYANAFDTLEEVAGSTESGEVQIENPEVNELGSGSIAWDWLEKIFKGIRDLLRP